MEEAQVQDIPRPKMRRVWVLNKHTQAWVEEFQGNKITVPPNHEKKVLMNYIEARHFLGQCNKMPAKFLPDGTYEGQPKALYTQELTSEETAELTGKTVKELKAEVKKEEKAAASACPICGKEFGNQKGVGLHVRKIHPEYEPVKNDANRSH